jgi:transposase
MRFEEIYGRFHKGRLNCEEAAGLLGISISSFRRRRRRFEEEGLEGLVDGRLGKASARRVPVDEVTRMLGLFETHYKDFTVKHFHEKLVSAHGFTRSYSWTKSALQAHGQVRHRRHYVKAKVHQYHDGQLAIFHGPRCLARCDKEGDLLNQQHQRVA